MIAWLAACTAPSPEPRTHEAYVWQRAWTDDLRAALRDGAPLFDGWRVAAGWVDRGGFHPVDVDLAALRETERPVVPVVRIDGELDPDGAAADALAEVARRFRAAGLTVPAAELDHDCPTARLAAYADFVGGLDPGVPVSVTALPTWLGAPALDALTGAADAVVLQVHAVDEPDRGLFDPARATESARAFAARTHRPFRVAVPAYGVAVGAGGVTAEAPRTAARADRELRVAPADVVGFLASLEADPPRGFAGEVWFRLPTRADTRAWSLEVLALARASRVPPDDVRIAADTAPDGAIEVRLTNRGLAWAPTPERVRLVGSCAAADGGSGFEARPDADGVVFVRPPAPLDPGEVLSVGWARCEGPVTVVRD